MGAKIHSNVFKIQIPYSNIKSTKRESCINLPNTKSSKGFPIFVYMETIPKNECRKIGYLQKPHGVQGDIILQIEKGLASSVEEEPTLFLEIDGLLVPFFLRPQGIKFRSDDSAVIHFDWIDNEYQARNVCGLSVYIKNEDILEEDAEISIHSLVGYNLFDSKLGFIGTIEQVDDYTGNLIFQLTYKGQELLIPFSEDFLVRFDKNKKEIELNCPDGIFNLN